ncbi:MAG: bifunctional folylpolyglutamate synthase/dihydrofolate synthase [Lachnospiraceae bacterium]|nr:bifunctional folylpolyglutamate synthase/dihydrofolate synthase [Lachnospiraceae bacterium]
MNYQEARAYIEKIQTELASDYTLRDVAELCERMGRPDRRLRIIHIAGTNGKGSVGAYISNALAMCGYTVGRYVSPTLFDYRERIQKIAGTEFGVETEWISSEEVAERMTELADNIDKMCQKGFSHPTAFEIETVMAFDQMAKWDVDVAVIEVGMGGMLDATNIIDRPLLTVFTEISMDHTRILGDTLEQIAEQKFGIIKAGTPVVSIRQEPVIMERLREICQRRGLKLQIAEPEQLVQLEFSMAGTRFFYQGSSFYLSQLGCYQPENVIVALEVMKQLGQLGFHKINISSVRAALKETKWLGRFEIVSKSPFLILDGAHNPSGAKVLRKSLEMYFPAERFTFVFGVFRDKDYQGILQQMLPLARRVYTVRAAGERGMEPEELAGVVRQYTLKREIPVESCINIAAALDKIQRQGEKEKIIVFGSLSFINEVYHYFDTAMYI